MERLIIAALLGLVAATICAVLAYAAPPPGTLDPAISAWFQSLRQPSNGISCCSEADCRVVEYRTSGAHYQAWVKDSWIDVPDEIVLHKDNPTGGAVLCATDDLTLLYCFVPGNEV